MDRKLIISSETLLSNGYTETEKGLYEHTRKDGYGTIVLSRDNGGHWNCKIVSSKIVCEIKNVVYLDDLHEQIEKLSEKVTFDFWEPVDETHQVVRFATSWATGEEDIDELMNILDKNF